ncbi:transcriptional regulator ATRX homolog [Nilaparvata lugens]|uniref:transcriptional regulator ATRX homolog n=1 Tax=Nilaparvata lugens TaxID=108931 RepID=UPI00193CA1BA|nr:transcriptional regulator ATRX homolog [Nilaparvata lugens]
MSRRHLRNKKTDAASTKIPAYFDDLSTFTLQKVLSKDSVKKTIVVKGNFTDRKGTAILIFERTPLTDEAVQSICTAGSCLERKFLEDQGFYICYPELKHGGINTTVIFPATDEDVQKYETLPLHIIEETPNQYNNITLPFISTKSSSIKWVRDILNHKSDQDRIIFEDTNPDVGFVLLTDSKWNQKEILNLCLVAIIHRQNIKSLRDLTAEHLLLLKNIREKATRAINKKYKVEESKLMIYIDYQPSYHHLHINFKYLEADVPGTQAEKSHLLNTVINNIEMVADYYQRCTLSFVVKENDELFSLFKQQPKVDAVDNKEDDLELACNLERTGLESDITEQSSSIFESSTLNNSDSIIDCSVDESTKNKSLFNPLSLNRTKNLGVGNNSVKPKDINNHDDNESENLLGTRKSRKSLSTKNCPKKGTNSADTEENDYDSTKENKLECKKRDDGKRKMKIDNSLKEDDDDAGNAVRIKTKKSIRIEDDEDNAESTNDIKTEKRIKIEREENANNKSNCEDATDDNDNSDASVNIKKENSSESEGDKIPDNNVDNSKDEDSDDIFSIDRSFLKKGDKSHKERELEAEEYEKTKKDENIGKKEKHKKKTKKEELDEENGKQDKIRNREKKMKEEVLEEDEKQNKRKSRDKKTKNENTEENKKPDKKRSRGKMKKEVSEDDEEDEEKETNVENETEDDKPEVNENPEEEPNNENEKQRKKRNKLEKSEEVSEKDKKYNDSKIKSEETEESEKDGETPSKRQRKEEIKEENGASGESSESEVEITKKKKQGLSKKKKNIVLSDSDEDYKVASESPEEKSSDSDAKATKRKKSASSSVVSSDEDSNKKTKKKRKRIINRGDSSSDNAEKEDEANLSQNKGRRNIKRIIKDKDVAETTRSAAKDEEERKQRILDRQKAYNEMFKLIEENTSKKIEKLVLDFDPKTKEELISVDKGLVAKMKPHQANGVKFMWDACFESVERINDGEGCGCILAHCMGLGKTFQVISLVHTVLSHQDLTKVRTVLVVCPFSTVLNWYGEFEKWMKEVEENDDLNVCHLSNEKVNVKRAYRLKDWHDDGGVMIIGYDMYRNLTNETSKAIKKKMREVFQRTLVDPGPDLIVCDEGHMLKNEATALSKAMNRIKTLRRIVLTGTPLQNNLSEYHCMVNFVKPNLLGSKKEFTNRFVNPITNGQFADSTERDFKIMKRRAHVLHKMLDGLVQRRDYNVLTPYLPPKQEYVLSIRLTELQVKLYREFLDTKVNINKGFRVTLFADFQQLSRIWTHPLALKYSLERQIKKEAMNDSGSDSAGSLKDFVIDSEEDDSTPASSSSESDDSSKKTSSKAANKTGRMTRANARNGNADLETMKDDPEVVANSAPEQSAWWNSIVKPEHLEDICVSSKLVLLFDFLKECELIGDKVLVFSQSLYSLDLIEHFLDRIDEATQNNCEESFLMGHMSSWAKGLDYFRLDGSTSGENRSAWIQSFNRESNTRARLFLISTRAGGLGINLTAANRVIIFDASWNPSHDIQSIFRVYRFGQRKPCYIYRFIAQGTMEEKVYERQIAKLSLSQRVVDEQQVNRYFSQNDLQELYNFTPADPKDAPIPTVPKDRLMADMLHSHKEWIFKIFEHDSLLDHVEEEELDEEERKAAWEDYENEKKRGFAINTAPSIQNMQMGNPFMQAGLPTYENVRQMLLAQNPQIPKEDLHKLVTNMLYQMYVSQQQKDILFRQQLQQQQYAAQSMGNQQPLPYQVVRNTFNLPVQQQARSQASTGTAPMLPNASQPQPSTSTSTNAMKK